MAEIREFMGEQTRKQSLVEMCEKIAQELVPLYEGKVIVGRNIYAPENTVEMGQPSIHIIEERPGKGIFSRTKRRSIFHVEPMGSNGFCCAGDSTGLFIQLFDDKTEAIVRKYLDQYVEEYGITVVHMQRGL